MLGAAKWQERRDAFRSIESGALEVGGAELAAAVEKEANATVVDAALDAIAAVAARDASRDALGAAVEGGILAPVIAKGVSSARAATARRGELGIEILPWSARPDLDTNPLNE